MQRCILLIIVISGQLFLLLTTGMRLNVLVVLFPFGEAEKNKLLLPVSTVDSLKPCLTIIINEFPRPALCALAARLLQNAFLSARISQNRTFMRTHYWLLTF
ncbi:hypothetical protein NPIL_351191 [Nephila pilipes]|uniref:Uncharacterized protein n=1 Tax=Nephila pilipes TaxID=299642 RepID=A0A8X6U377_NEPPI|nr:hypothetical protein NPIL_351191 [Nephila pilipes]